MMRHGRLLKWRARDLHDDLGSAADGDWRLLVNSLSVENLPWLDVPRRLERDVVAFRRLSVKDRARACRAFMARCR